LRELQEVKAELRRVRKWKARSVKTGAVMFDSAAIMGMLGEKSHAFARRVREGRFPAPDDVVPSSYSETESRPRQWRWFAGTVMGWIASKDGRTEIERLVRGS